MNAAADTGLPDEYVMVPGYGAHPRKPPVPANDNDSPAIDGVLTNARKVVCFSGLGYYLVGTIKSDGKGRFRDGDAVRTSYVTTALGGDVFRTRNSVYRVASWADDDPKTAAFAALRDVDGYVYVATPYSQYPGGMRAAFEAACESAAVMMRGGLVVFAPIAHGHACNVGRTDWPFWRTQCNPLLDAAAALCVVKMMGWQDSVGVTHEIARAKAAGKPIIYVEPSWLGVRA